MLLFVLLSKYFNILFLKNLNWICHRARRAGSLDTQVCECDNSRTRRRKDFEIHTRGASTKNLRWVWISVNLNSRTRSEVKFFGNHVIAIATTRRLRSSTGSHQYFYIIQKLIVQKLRVKKALLDINGSKDPTFIYITRPFLPKPPFLHTAFVTFP